MLEDEDGSGVSRRAVSAAAVDCRVGAWERRMLARAGGVGGGGWKRSGKAESGIVRRAGRWVGGRTEGEEVRVGVLVGGEG